METTIAMIHIIMKRFMAGKNEEKTINKSQCDFCMHGANKTEKMKRNMDRLHQDSNNTAKNAMF